MSLARTLANEGTDVSAYAYVPPKPNSLFHAKVVVGRVGFLGSANLTASGLGEPAETRIPRRRSILARAFAPVVRP